MKNHMKIIMAFIVFTLLGVMYLSVNLPVAKADSGWDNSYSDSGSSFSSSSWSSSSSSSHSINAANEKPITLGESKALNIFISVFGYVFVSLFIFIFTKMSSKKLPKFKKLMIIRLLLMVASIIIVLFLKKVTFPYVSIAYILIDSLLIGGPTCISIMNGFKKKPIEIKQIPKEKIIEFGLEEEKVKEQVYQQFVDIQKAWMNFDYDALQKLCSNELYNSYKSDLEVLKKKHGKNIMSDFKMIDAIIADIREEGNVIYLDCKLDVSFYDYVINEDTGEVIRGDRNHLYKNQYYLTFIKNKNIDKMTCPNCGGEVLNNKCTNCQSIVNNSYKDFVLDRKSLL